MCRVPARRGLSLLEVLVAMAILVSSVAVIGQLVRQSNDMARSAKNRSLAALRCQSKMAEIISGAQPMTVGQGNFEEDPDWSWHLTTEQGPVQGLWLVTLTVGRDLPGGGRDEFSLKEMVLDPAARGSTADTATITGDDTQDSSSGSGSSGSSSSGSSSSGSTPSTGGSTGGSTTPSTGGGTGGTRTGGGTTGGTRTGGSRGGS